MYVKFKHTTIDATIQYKVLNPTEVMEYDEVLKRYCAHIEIEVLGLVPKELLEEIEYSDQNTNAIDVAVKLSQE